MNYIKLEKTTYGNYTYIDASNIEMNILGNFLSCDVWNNTKSFLEWAIGDFLGTYMSGNVTSLDKEGNDVLLSELYSQEENPTELKMTRQQLIGILDEWQEKVCNPKPKEVVIKHENDRYWIETKN